MAKISARGATEVAALTAAPDEDGYGIRIVLASDGRILRRLTSRYSDGGARSHAYSIIARCKPLPRGEATEALLLRFATKRWPSRSWSVA